MPRSSRERNISQLALFKNAAQEQAAAAHVTTPRKFNGESQPVIEN